MEPIRIRCVEQTRFYRGDGRGNCVAAALASIFRLDLDDVDVPDGCSDGEIAAWSNARYPWLECRHVDHGVNYRVLEEGPQGRWTYDLPDEPPVPPTPGIWKAAVISPSGLLVAAGPWRGTPILHAVVMRGADLVWDPNPNYDWTTAAPTVVMSTWWTARDRTNANEKKEE
jgi:hypothetical protein